MRSRFPFFVDFNERIKSVALGSLLSLVSCSLALLLLVTIGSNSSVDPQNLDANEMG